MKKLILLLILLPYILFSQNNVLNETEKNTISSDINSFMNKCYEKGLFNGCVLVSCGDEIIYNKSFGYSNILKQVPINIDSKFDIGSLSKSFTAMAIISFLNFLIMLIKLQSTIFYAINQEYLTI